MTTVPMILLRAGSTVPGVRERRGDFPDWFARGLGRAVATGDLEILDPREAGEPSIPLERAAGLVITGSSAMVTDEEPWSLRAETLIARALAADLPILGVCYGHHLLARVAGGRVDWNPRGREIGTIRLRLHDAAHGDPLFRDLPRTFGAQASHQQCVMELPPGSTLLASSALDPHQAFRIRDRRAWGVQFHPEFDADIVRGYLDERNEDLGREGLDAVQLAAAAFDDATANVLLARFSAICAGGRR